jgi:NADH-quinone oxidoreductase subunit B
MSDPTALAPLATAGALTTTAEQIFAWARRCGVHPTVIGLACCASDVTAAADQRPDLAAQERLPLASAAPRASDVLLVAGTVSEKLVPWLISLWEQMPQPKWAVAVGACASCGGPFATYAVAQGVDRFLPIDLYIPGCPPSTAAWIEGLQRLEEKIGRPRRRR